MPIGEARDMGEPGGVVDAVVDEMEAGLAAMLPGDARRHFHATYLRTTRAIADVARTDGFADRDWVERWDVAFARLYLDALDDWDAGRPAAAWRIPFRTARDHPGMHPVLHVLFGMNVHINVDLPRALLAVISSDDFDDPEVVDLREQDHRRIDDVLLRRIAAEAELIPGRRTLLDRLLAPLNRRATARFLRESREKVWRNAQVLDAARRRGPEELDRTLARLDTLSAQRVRDLARPGPVLLRLAVRGFGVTLPAEPPGS